MLPTSVFRKLSLMSWSHLLSKRPSFRRIGCLHAIGLGRVNVKCPNQCILYLIEASIVLLLFLPLTSRLAVLETTECYVQTHLQLKQPSDDAATSTGGTSPTVSSISQLTRSHGASIPSPFERTTNCTTIWEDGGQGTRLPRTAPRTVLTSHHELLNACGGVRAKAGHTDGISGAGTSLTSACIPNQDRKHVLRSSQSDEVSQQSMQCAALDLRPSPVSRRKNVQHGRHAATASFCNTELRLARAIPRGTEKYAAGEICGRPTKELLRDPFAVHRCRPPLHHIMVHPPLPSVADVLAGAPAFPKRVDQCDHCKNKHIPVRVSPFHAPFPLPLD